MRLFIFGDITLDIINCVDALPLNGECRIIRSTSTFFGGRGANIAVAASRLGLDAALCSIAGRNFSSSGYEVYLKEKGVNIENLKMIEEAEMSRFFLYMNKKGQSYAFYEPSVDAYYDTFDFDDDRLKGYELVHFTLMHEKFAARCLKRLEKMDKIISAGFGKEIYLASEEFLKFLLGRCRYLFMNDAEAGVLMAKVGARREEELLQCENLNAIAITSAEKGSIIHTRKGQIRISAVRVKKVRNPIGAGDAYAAGFLSGLSKGKDLRICGRIATTVASFAVEGFGAQSSLPSLNQVKRRYLQAFSSPLP